MCLNSDLRKICLFRRAVHVLFDTLRHFLHNLKSAFSSKKSKNSPKTCCFNGETKVACTRGRKTRSRALYSMTHKAQTSIIDFMSLLRSQRILSSILCQGRTPPSRNEILVFNLARNWPVDFQTLLLNSTLVHEAVRKESKVDGTFPTLYIQSSLLRARC